MQEEIIENTGVPCQRCQSLQGTWELHSCPFAEEINDNYSESCNCCPDCEHECCMDI